MVPKGPIYHLSPRADWNVVDAVFNESGRELVVIQSQRADCAGPSQQFCELDVERSQERWGLSVVRHVYTEVGLAEYCDSVAAPYNISTLDVGKRLGMFDSSDQCRGTGLPCLDHVVILNESHLRRVLRAYAAYYKPILSRLHHQYCRI